MKPIEIVEVTPADLRAKLQRLATHEGYESPAALAEALRTGELDRDSFTAWEHRGITRILAAVEPQEAE